MANQFERDKVRRPCVAYIRRMLLYKQFNRYPFFYWTCPPDLGKQKPSAIARMKLDGYEKGVYDLTIIVGNSQETKVWLIEFKYGKNKLTTEQQKVFDDALPICNTKSIVIYSLEEFISFAENNLK